MAHTAHQVPPVHRQEPPVGGDSPRLGGLCQTTGERPGLLCKVTAQLHVAAERCSHSSLGVSSSCWPGVGSCWGPLPQRTPTLTQRVFYWQNVISIFYLILIFYGVQQLLPLLPSGSMSCMHFPVCRYRQSMPINSPGNENNIGISGISTSTCVEPMLMLV